MPVDRTLAQDLAQALVDLYTQAQDQLAVDLARRLADGLDSPSWTDDKLQALGTLRHWAEQLLRRLDGAMADKVAQALILAYARGGTAAMEELARLQSTHPELLLLAEVSDPSPRLREMIAARKVGLAAELTQVRGALPGIEALQRLTFSLVSKLRGTHLRILRWDEDAYRTVVARVSQDVLLGTTTRRRAAQIAWERLLSQGVTGFVDKANRNWELASYVEMAVRSTVAQAAVEGHLDRLGAAGLDLVTVSDAPQECIRCRPWEHKVLARTGIGGRRTVQLEHAIRDGELVDVEIAGTVAEAIAAGLMHPNCRHSLSVYLPGVTRLSTHTADPEGDAARQHLRHLERKVREWKRKEAAAIDPGAKPAAAAKVRDYQARIREHVDATGLIRQRPREQIGVAR